MKSWNAVCSILNINREDYALLSYSFMLRFIIAIIKAVYQCQVKHWHAQIKKCLYF